MDRRDLAGKEKVLGTEHPETLTSVSKTGSVFQIRENTKRQKRCIDESRKAMRRCLGESIATRSPVSATSGQCWTNREDTKRQKRCNDEPWKAMRRCLDESIPTRSPASAKRGQCWTNRENTKRKKRRIEGALKGYDKVPGREHHNTHTSVNNFGLVLNSQGEYEEAEAMHRLVLKGREKMVKREHPPHAHQHQ